MALFNFFLPRPPKIWPLNPAEIDPDQQSRLFFSGVVIWTLLSFLRLKQAGLPVRLVVENEISSGFAIGHFDVFLKMLNFIPANSPVATVCMVADRRGRVTADFELVQNYHQVTNSKQFYVPHWPQPGLRKRNPDRGHKIHRATAKARLGNLHPDMRTEEFKQTLQSSGIQWIVEHPEAIGKFPFQIASNDVWSDYSECDLIISLRNGLSNHEIKPASKLVNSWLAGVPCILGPESAYQALRSSPLDYIEATSTSDAAAAAVKLSLDSELYAAMVEQARLRGAQHNTITTVNAWIAVLEKMAERAKNGVTTGNSWIAYDGALPAPVHAAPNNLEK